MKQPWVVVVQWGRAMGWGVAVGWGVGGVQVTTTHSTLPALPLYLQQPQPPLLLPPPLLMQCPAPLLMQRVRAVAAAVAAMRRGTMTLKTAGGRGMLSWTFPIILWRDLQVVAVVAVVVVLDGVGLTHLQRGH